MAPGMGDDVQAIKAGILECADVFAVNKADRDGADSTVRDLELMIALGKETFVAAGKSRAHVVHSEAAGMGGPTKAAGEGELPERWTPPIHKCIALRGQGVAELVAGLEAHRRWLEGTESGRQRRRERLAEEVRDALREALLDAALGALGAKIDEAVAAVDARAQDPYTATERLIEAFRRS
jgi:LAO/AO transport system kinase